MYVVLLCRFLHSQNGNAFQFTSFLHEKNSKGTGSGASIIARCKTFDILGYFLTIENVKSSVDIDLENENK